MNKSVIKASIGMAILFYVIATIFCICYQLLRRDYSDWIKTEATVIYIWDEQRSDTDGLHYEIDWSRFTYKIDGTTYTNETSGFKKNVGDKIEIYVNPENYSDSIIIEDIWNPSLVWGIAMFSVTIINIAQMCFHILPEVKKNHK